VIDNGRDFVVRRDLEKRGIELRAILDIDAVHTIGQPHFLEHDRNLLSVWRHPCIEVDHAHYSLPVTAVASKTQA